MLPQGRWLFAAVLQRQRERDATTMRRDFDPQNNIS
jgi:hypothetical protein